MSLKSTVLTDVPTLIYQSNGCSAVTTIYFCNASSVTIQFDVYAVPRPLVPDLTNLIYHQIPLHCNDTYVLDTEKLVLEHGDALYAKVLVPAGEVIANLKVISTVSAIGV
jgi:hypothetical protein